MTEERIREVINRFINLYKENPNRWKNERQSHHEFFQLLFSTFAPDEIKNNFKWEYPVGVPSYGTGSKEAAVDIVFVSGGGKWIAIEIELVGAGKELEDELIKCVSKLKTAYECRKCMRKGYIVPLLVRKAGKKARGYGISYSELCEKTIKEAEKEIKNSPIEIVRGGILFKR